MKKLTSTAIIVIVVPAVVFMLTVAVEVFNGWSAHFAARFVMGPF